MYVYVHVRRLALEVLAGGGLGVGDGLEGEGGFLFYFHPVDDPEAAFSHFLLSDEITKFYNQISILHFNQNS